MAEKYHISPTTGNPNRCYATKKACPHGGVEDHYGSKAEARKAFEEKQSSKAVVKSARKKREKVLPTRRQGFEARHLEIITAFMREEGFLSSKRHEEQALEELRKGGSEHWYSNGAAEFKILYSEHSGYELYNFRNIASPALENVFAQPRLMAKSEAQLEEPLSSTPDPKITKLLQDAWDRQNPPSEEIKEVEPDVETLINDDASIDDDFSDIKCEDCKQPLDKCICNECPDCGAYVGDEHEEDCFYYKPSPKAYSWD